MAQAARLNLRMQKELKLLLTDPPPGASFPLLSADLDSNCCPNSLSTIDAQIEGPEGTVYADGVFHVRIQIPERYPFQPPNVTFSTPIYHPNIDNGGRICLDILNLPPKGAWQPSLNISTVLTSIGLLLSEPNPDDGLMCDASREYKYNRQAFDQKARSMTEKYAKAGASENSCCSQSIPANSNTSMMEFKTTGGDFRHVDECVDSQKNICRSRWNLLLNSSGSAQKRDNNKEVNEGPNDRTPLLNYKNQVEIEGAKKGSKGKDYYHQDQEKEHRTWRKLSLETFGRFQNRESNDNENLVPNCCLLPNPLEPIVASSGSSSLPKVDKHEGHQGQDERLTDNSINMRSARKLTVVNKQPPGSSNTCQITDIMASSNSKSYANSSHGRGVPTAVNSIEIPHNFFVDEVEHGYSDIKRKMLCSAGKKLPLGFRGSSQTQEIGNKENVAPVQKTSLMHPTGPSMCSSTSPMLSKVGCYDSEPRIGGLVGNHKKRMIGQKLSLGSLFQSQGSHDDNRQISSHSKNQSEDPHMNCHTQQHCKSDNKQKLDCDQVVHIEEQIKRQRADESPISESVIVLDSEDSEDEGCVSLRSKSLLARKRFGKWKAKA